MTRQIFVGGVPIGGGAAGCQIVRVAVPDLAAAKAVGAIKDQIDIPLVVDIHFDYRLALACVEEGCDAVVGILAPKEVRIRRIMAREGISEDYARRRVEAQQGDGFFRAHCGYILENREDDTPEAFRARARALFEQILQI